MRWCAGALLLLLVQYFAGCGGADREAWWRRWLATDGRTPVEALLEGEATSEVPYRIVGRVADVAPRQAGGVRLTVEAETAERAGRGVVDARGSVALSLRSTRRSWHAGDRVAFRSRLRRIASFGNFGEFDWAAFSARRGIRVSAYAWNDDAVAVLAARDGWVDAWRRRFAVACEARGGTGAAMVKALVVGDRTSIAPEVAAAVRDAGLAHHLAISGAHMALLLAAMSALVLATFGRSERFLLRFDVMRLVAACGAAAVLAYAAASGGGISVARSVLMAMAAMAALWHGVPGDAWRALGASAIVLALAYPGVGEEAGFQLSYLAVAALLAHGERTREAAALRRAARPLPMGREEAAPRPAERCLRAILEVFRIAVICWAVTTPIVAHHFARVALYAPLANLMAAPFVAAAVLLGIAALFLLPVAPAAAEALLVVAALAGEAVAAVAAGVSALPAAAFAVPVPGALVNWYLSPIFIWYLSPIVLSPIVRFVGVGVAVVAVAWGVGDRYARDRLDVVFASVGQGDAAIVRFPGGRVAVVDTGPPGFGRMAVGPLLRRLWIGRIDVLVASHVQADHAGAAPELLEDFDVGEVWLPAGPCDAALFAAIERTAAKRGVAVERIVAGARAERRADALVAGTGASLDVLAPPSSPAGDGACDDNDRSIVLAVAFAGRRVLLTGDIEAAAERELLARARMAGGAGLLRADVLKVAHHGSATSSTAAFLDAVAPAVAVASLGSDNPYGFPSPEVEERLRERGGRLLRTDRDGAVRVRIARRGTRAGDTVLTIETGRRGEAAR